MPKQKLTPWFPADVMPVHPGVYERNAMGSNFRYWYFNGKYWVIGGYSRPDVAMRSKERRPSSVSYPWRGLISPIPTNQPQEKLL